jgi:putative membrane-bound dehydrogenase-like protein
MKALRGWVLFQVLVSSVAQSLPKPPPDWQIELVAQAPAIKHPSVVCCAPDGRVFVAEDPMDISLPKADLAEGRILCLHPDGGRTVFAERLYAVFGMQFLDGKLYVVHSPKLSVFTDEQGRSGERIDLIESLNPNPWALDWNDHVPANFRLAMDGYLYVAVGDKGVYGAVGRDGKRVDLHGGGILRLRPDGTELEVYCTGVRNILDVAVNAEDEIFTYDNTDEQQWMSRVTHMADGGFYGYPYDFIPRRPYTLWCMADYGGGAATGAFCYNEDALPVEYHGNLFLADFGKRQLLRLRIERDGATYKVVSRQDFFTDPPDDFRPVGICLSPDGTSIYVCDWHHRDTKENVTVGRLWKLTYTGRNRAAPKPDWYQPAAQGKKVGARTEELLKGLSHPAQSVRLAAQRELVERGTTQGGGRRREEASPMDQSLGASAVSTQLGAVLRDPQTSAYARWHSLWALDAIDKGASARKTILAAVNDSDPSVRRQAIRQLGTRQVPEASRPLIARLKDRDASVRFQAATALGRIAERSPVPALIAALDEEDSFVRYGVFTALNRIGRADDRSWPLIAKGLESKNPRIREGTVFALRETYEPLLVRALADMARAPAKRTEARVAALELLAQIHRRKPAWKGQWWAYHPVNSPPPPKTVEWEGTAVVHSVLRERLGDRERLVRLAAVEGVREAKVAEASPRLRELFRAERDLDLKRSLLAALGELRDAGSLQIIGDLLADPLGNAPLVEAALSAAGKTGTPEAGNLLANFLKSGSADKSILIKTINALGTLKTEGTVAVMAPFARHGDPEIRRATLSALSGIDRDSASAVLAPLLDDESLDVRRDAVTALGEWKARSALPGLLAAYRDSGTKWEAVAALAQMPDVRAVDAYLDGLGGKNPTLRALCRKAIEAIREKALPAIETKLGDLSSETVAELQTVYAQSEAARRGRLFEVKVKKLEAADYLAFAMKQDGDAARGRKVFYDLEGVACVKCHRVAGQGGEVGPDLTTTGAQLGRKELAESILYPSRAIREGYQRVEVETEDDETIEGLVQAESNEWLTLRDANGKNHQIAKEKIKERRHSQLSLMPEGLEAGMSLEAFADLLAYLSSLREPAGSGAK